MQNANRRTAVIDCHAHVVPEALLLELPEIAPGGSFGARRTEQGWLVRTPEGDDRLIREGMFSSARRGALIAERGIELQILSPWLDLQPTESMPAPHARAWAARINDALIAEAGPTSLGGPMAAFATVALDDPDTAAKDLGVAVQEQRMAGLVLSTNPAHCEDLADPRLEPLWEAAQALQVPIMLHPPADGPSRILPDSGAFGNAYCRLVDTTFAVAKLILAGVLDRYPQLQLITVHGGGFLPYQAMRLDGAHRADALASWKIERAAPSDYLGDLYYDTVALSGGAIRFLADTIGADRLLLGSDLPFPLGDRNPVKTIKSAGLSATATEAVLGGTISTLISGGRHA